MQEHPSCKAYKSNGTMTDDEFRHFILSLVIGRLFNSEEAFRNLDHVSMTSLKAIYNAYHVDKSRFKKHPAYQLNSTYGKAGMDMAQFIFELVPMAVAQLPPLSQLKPSQAPLSIVRLSEQLNTCLQEALPAWYAKLPNQTSYHEYRPPGTIENRPGSETRKSGWYEFQMRDNKIVHRPKDSKDDFKDTHVTTGTLNYKFNFSQAFADAAALCPNLVSLDSGMVPGTGTKTALDRFNPGRKGKANEQAELQAWYQELKKDWPQELPGSFNVVTLEHSLCEWVRWLEVRLGHSAGKKNYNPKDETLYDKVRRNGTPTLLNNQPLSLRVYSLLPNSQINDCRSLLDISLQVFRSDGKYYQTEL